LLFKYNKKRNQIQESEFLDAFFLRFQLLKIDFLMILLRLSGHSGAGKTRLVNALPKFGITCPKVLRYTSRPPRKDEHHGQDYYFMSRSFIEKLPEEDFLVGPVRNMLQAFDLNQIELDLKGNDIVLVEIYPDLWPRLMDKMHDRLGNKLKTASVFMTAVDPAYIAAMPDDRAKSSYIIAEVRKNITRRNMDSAKDIEIRASSAAKEILEALGPAGSSLYDKILYSAPEGPDGQDDWTREEQPIGQAKIAMDEFIGFYAELRHQI
jgi:hypothetical protein